MNGRRVEACCVLTADGKTRPCASAPRAVRAWLRGLAGRCDSVVRPSSGAPDALVAALGRVSGRRVLVEGGPEILRGAIAAGILTHLHAAILPVVAGGAEAPTVSGFAASALLRRSVALRLRRLQRVDGAALASYSLEKSASARSRPALQRRA